MQWFPSSGATPSTVRANSHTTCIDSDKNSKLQSFVSSLGFWCDEIISAATNFVAEVFLLIK